MLNSTFLMFTRNGNLEIWLAPRFVAENLVSKDSANKHYCLHFIKGKFFDKYVAPFTRECLQLLRFHKFFVSTLFHERNSQMIDRFNHPTSQWNRNSNSGNIYNNNDFIQAQIRNWALFSKVTWTENIRATKSSELLIL